MRRTHTLAGLIFLGVFVATGVYMKITFFVEPAVDRLERPVAQAGVALALVGTALHRIAGGKPNGTR